MNYRPVFTVDSPNHLRRLSMLLPSQPELDYGLLVTAPDATTNLWRELRLLHQDLYLDSGVFNRRGLGWHLQETRTWTGSFWYRSVGLKPDAELRHHIRGFINRCEALQPDYAFAPDVLGEPLISLHLARLCWQEWQQSPVSERCTLMGVVQAGLPLYHWQSSLVPGGFNSPPAAAVAFVKDLVVAYRSMGYEQVALGGLLKPDPLMPMGLKFGLSLSDFDRVLSQVPVDFVLGGLSLSRLPLLQQHEVAADSTNWLWWNATYDAQRFVCPPLLGTA